MKSVLTALALLAAPASAAAAPLDPLETTGDLPELAATDAAAASAMLPRPGFDRDHWILDGPVLTDDLMDAVTPPNQWARPADRHPNVLPGLR